MDSREPGIVGPSWEERSAENPVRSAATGPENGPRERLGLHAYFGRTEKIGRRRDLPKHHPKYSPGKRVGTRRIYVSPGTLNPNDAWVQDQADAMLRFAKRSKLGVEIVMHDRDRKFTAGFDAKFTDAGAKVQKSPIRSPNIVAYVERVIQTLQCEVLDYFFVFGEKHLNYIVREAVDYCLTCRPHQGLENELIQPPKRRRKTNPAEVLPMSEIGCTSRLGRLLKHYYRKAA
jgi:putative transposase